MRMPNLDIDSLVEISGAPPNKCMQLDKMDATRHFAADARCYNLLQS